MGSTKKDFWNAQLYDTSHAFVSSYGNDLVDLLQVHAGEAILDVGCGTGDLAHTIQQMQAHVTGIDFSENMIQQAQLKYPDIPFIAMDITKMHFHEQFDAVFSNATLHWVLSAKEAAQNIYNSLKPGGRFVAEFGGADNVRLITDELIKQIKAAGIVYNEAQFPWYFPTIGEYTSLLEATEFQVSYAHHFSRPTKLNGEDGLLNWLEMFTPSIFEQVKPAIKRQIFQQTIESLRPVLYMNGEWFADYKRLRIIATKGK